jgi:hypothetical protein
VLPVYIESKGSLNRGTGYKSIVLTQRLLFLVVVPPTNRGDFFIERQRAEGRRQKAEGRRQKAEGRRQKAENFGDARSVISLKYREPFHVSRLTFHDLGLPMHHH